jgi:hypothetical protein
MRHRAIIALLALAPLAALAQQASEQEQATLASIAQCLVAGLPQNWQLAEMNVVLPEPGAPGGEVTYRMSRLLEGKLEPFQPCDERKPAEALVELRKMQDEARAGWNAARFVIYRDGKFDLMYEYPKKN